MFISPLRNINYCHVIPATASELLSIYFLIHLHNVLLTMPFNTLDQI
jgi:hypothetical protein